MRRRMRCRTVAHGAGSGVKEPSVVMHGERLTDTAFAVGAEIKSRITRAKVARLGVVAAAVGAEAGHSSTLVDI